MHRRRIAALDEKWLIPIAAKEFAQFLAADTRKNGRIRDLEPIEMQDGKNRAITLRIEEFVGMPTGGERTGFRLAITHHTRDDEVGIVKSGTIGVQQRITEFAAFIDRSRGFRSG